jgi:hypothetical protein
MSNLPGGAVVKSHERFMLVGARLGDKEFVADLKAAAAASTKT